MANNNVSIEIITRENEVFGEVRFAVIDGKEYAVASDVAKALGYADAKSTISKKCKGVAKIATPTNGGIQKISYIGESDIYRLIFGSKLKSAEKFQDWVFNEVLPQIRKTGGYIPVTENMSDAEIMAKALMVAQKTLDEKDELIKEKTRQLEEQKPKVDGFMQFIDVGDSLSFGNVAKNLGIGRNTFMKILRDEKILQEEVMIINGHKKYGEKHNVPYQQFMKYFIVKFKPTKKKKVTVTRVTSKGQDYLRKKLLKLGYLE